jgi:hypothetical protein
MTAAAKRNGVQPVVYDLGLLFPVLLLLGMGIVMVYSASSALALKKFGSDYFFLKKQAMFSLIGIMVLVAFSYIPFRLYRVLVYPALAADNGHAGGGSIYRIGGDDGRIRPLAADRSGAVPAVRTGPHGPGRLHGLLHKQKR